MAPERKTLSELSDEYGIPLAYIERWISDEVEKISARKPAGIHTVRWAVLVVMAKVEPWCKKRNRSSRRRKTSDARQPLLFE